MPRSRPAVSTTGPPEAPRGRGAVCSMLPAMRRPRGPRKAPPTPETSPKVTPGHPPDGAAVPAEHHRRLLAAEVVGVSGHQPVGQHHPRPAPLPPADPDHRGPDPLGNLADGLLQLVEHAHAPLLLR